MDQYGFQYLGRKFSLTFLFFTGSWAIEIDVTPREATVLPDQNVTFLCRVPVPLQYCRIQIPGLKPYNLNNNLSTGGVSTLFCFVHKKEGI